MTPDGNKTKCKPRTRSAGRVVFLISGSSTAAATVDRTHGGVVREWKTPYFKEARYENKKN